MEKQQSLHRTLGFALVLAWPNTYCKQAGAWYDPIMKWAGFNKNGYYKAGHAAIVLICPESGKCHYFDFGRYHAPFGHGRVRSAETDPELTILQTAQIIGDHIHNLHAILEELSENESCHGSGPLHASVSRISLPQALSKAINLQKKSPLPYGPFVPQGSNCSRFVQKVLLAGLPFLWHRIKLTFPYSITPTPATNVHAVGAPLITENAIASSLPQHINLSETLLPPPYANTLPKNAHWHSGEGAGSWFHIEQCENGFLISRYSAGGVLEFQDVYQKAQNLPFYVNQPFKVAYPSHYGQIILTQSTREVVFLPLSADSDNTVPKTNSSQGKGF
ncbi:hypothetical protein DN752_05910 [Echinicola strongylocentroti]|uniref:Uncharacterized protein n=1 Tax=Echinicola strongylocentroti TaxID=1795355 RepID=A0A2Z4IFG6_9BACT|nr:DUF6695 family protein [Echinicola strongylocentroti]AWW29694.1 hypothetical protein DN752_05910 [Echinicola strongylocentroti]